MARQLWFLRHGDAEPHGTRPDSRAPADRARRAAVARRGRGAQGARDRAGGRSTRAPRCARAKRRVLAGRELGVEPVEHAALAGGFDAGEALELAASADESDGPVLLVGHEPDFSQVVHDLSGARIDMKKGGVAGVRLDGARGELIVLLRPRELSRVK